MMPARLYMCAAGIVAGVVLASLAVAWHRGAVQDVAAQAARRERDSLAATTSQALLDAERRNWDLQTKAAIAEMENEIEQTRLKDQARAAADRARSADERLQHAVANVRRRAVAAAEGPAPAPFADEAAASATALGECGRRYREMGAVADELSIQVTGLQRYVTTFLAVCTADNQPTASKE